MVDDPRCCGTGTCLIDAQGRCWCGQEWDGKQMCFAKPGSTSEPTTQQLPAAAPPCNDDKL